MVIPFCACANYTPDHMTQLPAPPSCLVLVYLQDKRPIFMPHNFVRMSTSEEKRICERVSDKLLDSRVSDIHIAEIASNLVDWESLAPHFGLTESERKEIREDFEGRYNLQKRKALRVWRWKNGDKATYRQLIGICCRNSTQKLVDLAESIVKYLGPDQRPSSSLVLNDTFYRYLLDCYSVISHPSIKQWPSKAAMHINIPQAYFDLILYDAPLNIPSSSSLLVNESCFKAVTLRDALTKSTGANRLLVYFEGIAGSGKTTLSWHACREWGEKRILQHFNLLIHIELSNPKVKEATNLADLIPYPDKALQQIIATEIVHRKGEGICLLLDGLDEAPSQLLDFLLVDLIQGRPGVPQVPNLSFVMTSRPDSHVTERLEPVLHSRVIIKGFNRENLHQFLDQSLGVDTKMRMKLMEKCEINPKLEGLCSLPINAVIMSFLIHCIEDDGPATQTGLYKPFISNFLLRHLDIRQAMAERPLIECLLNDVPVEIRDAFQKICSLAYHSSLEGKQLFTKKELGHKDMDIDNTLGLLQVHPQITMYGSERYYKFFHLSLQEFLAAIHLSKHDQPSSIKKVLSKVPQRQVLPFYAGLTQLKNRKALRILSQALGQAIDQHAVAGQLLKFNDSRQKSLAFINCLYECQSKALLELPETQLTVNSSLQNAVSDLVTKASIHPPISPPFHTLSLKFLPLSPIDCLSLGYFLRVKSCLPILYGQSLGFDLTSCSIEQIGLRVLLTELKKSIHERTQTRVQLILAYNTMYHESLPYLKQLLEGQSNVEGLGLCHCFDPDIVDLCYVLKCLIEGLSNNSSCTYINLSANHFKSFHIFYFLLMLQACPQLSYLNLEFFDLHVSILMSIFSSAMQFSSIQCLDLSHCSITDSALALLGRTISNHPSLYMLNVYYNSFTPAGLSNFLRNFVDSRFSRLSFLGVSIPTNMVHKQILKEIKLIRTLYSHPHLILKSLYDTPYTDLYRGLVTNLQLLSQR